MRRRNIIAAAALLVLTIGYGALTTLLPERSLPDTPGPPFFPWVNTVILFALSVGLLLQGILGKTENGIEQPPMDLTQRWQTVWALGTFVLYLMILPGLGFLVATTPFFAVLMVLYGERRWLWITLGSIAMTVFLYVLFRHGFNVFLPRGVFPDLFSVVFL